MGKQMWREALDEDFENIAMLKQLAREGKVRILVEAADSITKTTLLNNVRAYIARAVEMVAPKYRATISVLWDRLLEIDELTDTMMPDPRARKCKEFNKYAVMRVIGILNEHGFYGYRKQQELNLALEGVRENRYRSYLGKGIDDRKLLLKVRAVISEFEI